jgi:hypothetical protein
MDCDHIRSTSDNKSSRLLKEASHDCMARIVPGFSRVDTTVRSHSREIIGKIPHQYNICSTQAIPTDIRIFALYRTFRIQESGLRTYSNTKHSRSTFVVPRRLKLLSKRGKVTSESPSHKAIRTVNGL